MKKDGGLIFMLICMVFAFLFGWMAAVNNEKLDCIDPEKMQLQIDKFERQIRDAREAQGALVRGLARIGVGHPPKAGDGP